jgi:hypothetical protein
MSDARALVYRLRLNALFSLHAEHFTLVRAGSGSDQLGLFLPMDNSVTSTFFDANESVGLQKPALTLYMEPGDNPSSLCRVNDVFNRDDRLWTVRKTHVYRIGNTPLVLLVLSD